MKIAICISGNLGSKKRSGERKNWNIKNLNNESYNGLYSPELGYNHLKKILLDKHDCDTFFHCWSNSSDVENKLVQLYKPKKYIVEEQKKFDISLNKYNFKNDNINSIFQSNISNNCKIGYKILFDSRKNNNDYLIKELNVLAFRTSSRLYSLNKSIDMMKEYKVSNNKNHDWILICRFDSFWNFPIHHANNNNFSINLKNLNKNFSYVERRIGRVDYNHAIFDLWFLLSEKNLNTFDNIFSKRFNYCMRGPFYFYKLLQEQSDIDSIKDIREFK